MSKMQIFTRTYVFQYFLAFFDPKTGPRSPQDRSKTGPRAIKNDAFFVLIFDSFWGRLGVVLGALLSSKIDPKSFLEFILFRLVFDLSIYWHHEGPKTVPRELKSPQDRPKTPQEVVLGSFWIVLGSFWGSISGFHSTIRFIDVIH